MIEVCHFASSLIFVVWKEEEGEYSLSNVAPEGFSLVNGFKHWNLKKYPEEIHEVGSIINDLINQKRFLVGVIDFNDSNQLGRLQLKY